MSCVYQLKITIQGSKPPIWRRLLVTSDTSLEVLHDIIQMCFSWENYHLYAFQIGEHTIDQESNAELSASLENFSLAENDHFKYIYDFGDDWLHDIHVEKIEPPKADQHYPCCLAGKRAGPPEDSGGIWGYTELLEALGNRHHPDHQEMRDWVGRHFDPEQCDISAINRRLIALSKMATIE